MILHPRQFAVGGLGDPPPGVVPSLGVGGVGRVGGRTVVRMVLGVVKVVDGVVLADVVVVTSEVGVVVAALKK